MKSLFALFLCSISLFALIIETGEVKQFESPITAMHQHADKLYVGLMNGKVFELDAQNEKVIREFNAHNDWVGALACSNETLYTAAYSGEIKQWEEGRLVKKADAHKWWITGLLVHEGKLVSISYDQRMKIWDTHGLRLEKELGVSDFDAKPRTMIVHNGRFVFGSTHLMTRSIDTDTYQTHCMKTGGQYDFITALVSLGQYYYGAGTDGAVYRFDDRACQRDTLMKVSEHTLLSMAIVENTLFVGDSKGDLHIINLKTNMKETRHMSDSALKKIAVFQRKVFLGTADGELLAVNAKEF